MLVECRAAAQIPLQGNVQLRQVSKMCTASPAAGAHLCGRPRGDQQHAAAGGRAAAHAGRRRLGGVRQRRAAGQVQRGLQGGAQSPGALPRRLLLPLRPAAE